MGRKRKKMGAKTGGVWLGFELPKWSFREENKREPWLPKNETEKEKPRGVKSSHGCRK